MDFDLGFAFDDFVGCDTTLQCFFTYNNSNSDNEYGSPPPAIGATFLNSDMYSFTFYQNDFYTPGDSGTSMKFYKKLTGFWVDSIYNTRFMFPGDLHDTTQWSQLSQSPSIPNDPRTIGSIGPFSWAPGETLCQDIAFTYARDDYGDNLTSVDSLKSAILKIRQFYQNKGFWCNFDNPTGLIAPESYNELFSVRPNPTSGKLLIIFKNRIPGNGKYRVRLFNVSGQLFTTFIVDEAQPNILLDVSRFARGFYILQIQGQTLNHFEKIVLQ